jgi:hypothetical protein
MTNETLAVLTNALKNKIAGLAIMEEAELFKFEFSEELYSTQVGYDDMMSKFYLGAIHFGPPYVFHIYRGAYFCARKDEHRTFTIIEEGSDTQFSVFI